MFFKFTLFKSVVRVDSCHNLVAFFMRKCKCLVYSGRKIFFFHCWMCFSSYFVRVKGPLIKSHSVQDLENRSVGGINYWCVYLVEMNTFFACIFLSNCISTTKRWTVLFSSDKPSVIRLNLQKIGFLSFLLNLLVGVLEFPYWLFSSIFKIFVTLLFSSKVLLSLSLIL